MRWDSLFLDLERQLDAAGAAGLREEVAALVRAERASVTLGDRWRYGTGRLRVTLRCGEVVEGDRIDAGPEWLLLADGGREHLVPGHAVVAVRGLDRHVAAEAGAVARRLGLGHALRALARDRAVVRVLTAAGEEVGRIDAVGADHVDLAAVHPDTWRPAGGVVAVALAGVDLVSRVGA